MNNTFDEEPRRRNALGDALAADFDGDALRGPGNRLEINSASVGEL